MPSLLDCVLEGRSTLQTLVLVIDVSDVVELLLECWFGDTESVPDVYHNKINYKTN